MAYAELHLQEKWFGDATPSNPKHARAILTFTGNVVASETVTINDTVFEFVAAAEDIAEETNIPVVVGENLTSENAVAKLVAAITTTLDYVVASAGKDTNENHYCGIAYYKVGTAGNAVTIATTCTNASFGEEVTNLSGGQYGTPCPIANTVVYADNFYYWCKKAGNRDNVVWERFQPATY